MSDVARAEVARRLARALRRPQRQVGERAYGRFVIALADDSVGYVSEQVDSVGGTASVVIALGADLHVFGWTQVTPTDTPLFDEVERQPVDPSAPMAMLLQLVTAHPGGNHAIYVEKNRSVRLFDGELLLAPA